MKYNFFNIFSFPGVADQIFPSSSSSAFTFNIPPERGMVADPAKLEQQLNAHSSVSEISIYIFF